MTTIRMQLLATTAILALGGTAYAADMAVKAPPPVAPAPAVINWTGFYVGGQIGGASFDPSCDTFANFGFLGNSPCQFSSSEGATSSSLSSSSFIGGFKVGYDWQFWSSAVVGVVGEWDWAHLHTNTQTIGSSDGPTGTSVGTASEHINWLASVRGRLGWAFDNVLFYGTGGVAWTQIKASASLTGTCCGDWSAPQVSLNKTGAVAGGGFEYRFTPNVSVVGEVLWYGFGSVSLTGRFNSDGDVGYTTTFKSNDILAGTLGVNWRF